MKIIKTNKLNKEIISDIKNTSNIVVVITGPTGSGKTKLSHSLSDEINSYLISCDSRQIYKELNIGSNKPKIQSHMFFDGIQSVITNDNHIYSQLDYLDVNKEYSAQKYREDTRWIIKKKLDKEQIPIIVGGSVHWVKSLISEQISPYYKSDKDIYTKLSSLSLKEIQKEMVNNNIKEYINYSDWKNKRRLSRYLEYFLITGQTIPNSTKFIKNNWEYYVIHTYIENRLEYEQGIKKSIIDRLEQGWILEVENLIKYSDIENIILRLGMGYRIIYEYIKSEKIMKIEDLIKKLTTAEMQYAKKQNLQI